MGFSDKTTNRVSKPNGSKQLSTAQSLADKIKQKALQNMKEKKEAENKSDSESEKSDEEEEKEEDEAKSEATITSFEDLDLVPELQATIKQLNFTKPTEIQAKSIPAALKGSDIIGIAQTGSGKTAAFAIPVLNQLWYDKLYNYCLVLVPTRELALQIQKTFDALGLEMGLKTCCVVGGMNMIEQSRELMKKPHIIIATPGRLMDHLENTKGFNLKNLKFLIMDEADRLLDLEFGPAIDKILKILPVADETNGRRNFLFSATLTEKLNKLTKVALRDPTLIKCNENNKTVETLVQSLIVVPGGLKNTILVYLLSEHLNKSVIIFTRTKSNCERLNVLLNMLDFQSCALHGDLSQQQRNGALDLFKAGKRNLLIATDVAARGLDIPFVDMVINYDIPVDSKSYIHRVGRTARAGRSGKSISLVSQYDLELILRIEQVLGFKLQKDEINKQLVLQIRDNVERCNSEVIMEMNRKSKEKKNNRKRGARSNRDDMDKSER